MKIFAAFLLVLNLALFSGVVHADDTPDVERLSWQMFSLQGEDKREPIQALSALNDKSLIPTLVLAMRWTGSNIYVAEALSKLAGQKITHWHEAYDFQELNPQIKPHESYHAIKMKLLGNTDKKFLDFFAGNFGKPDNMKIRLEEITWGGVLVDGITSLDNPKMIAANDANYLLDDDLVFGVEINGDIRAYPLRIMGWHEMFNDTIGGVPVALAYCTLCGAGILFETQVEGRDTPLVFGSSGLLYRSNKLMFDRETKSLWNQFTGEPVVGPLVQTDIKLKIRPNTITTWADWKAKHPNTKVLSLETGYARNYGSGVTYQAYFASPDLMFPAVVGDEKLVKRKDYIFGIRDVGAAKAWPIKAFVSQPVINDRVGLKNVVLIGDANTRTVRAYERDQGETFAQSEQGVLISKTSDWVLNEDFLVSKDGKNKRSRVPGHVAFWFAWDNYLGVKSDIYSR
jgi:hypothetical protein